MSDEDKVSVTVKLSQHVVESLALASDTGELVSYTPAETVVKIGDKTYVVGNEEVLEGLPDEAKVKTQEEVPVNPNAGQPQAPVAPQATSVVSSQPTPAQPPVATPEALAANGPVADPNTPAVDSPLASGDQPGVPASPVPNAPVSGEGSLNENPSGNAPEQVNNNQEGQPSEPNQPASQPTPTISEPHASSTSSASDGGNRQPTAQPTNGPAASDGHQVS